MARSLAVLKTLNVGDVITDRGPLAFDRSEQLELHLVGRSDNGLLTFNVCLYGHKLCSLAAKPEGEGFKWLLIRL